MSKASLDMQYARYFITKSEYGEDLKLEMRD